MATPAFSDVQAALDSIITQDQADIDDAPHGRFWRSYTDPSTGQPVTVTAQIFASMDVPGGLTDPDGNPVPVCVPGDANNSPILWALLGTHYFDGSMYPRMPADGPDYLDVTDARYITIAGWIAAGCPD
jgi:hypothetical protein